MKVYVMSGREIDDRISGREVLLASEIELGTFDDTEIASMQYHLARLKETRAAMTPIDIPDGCKLAVVAMNDMPSNDPTGGKDTRVWYAEHYRRVVQEVM